MKRFGLVLAAFRQEEVGEGVRGTMGVVLAWRRTRSGSRRIAFCWNEIGPPSVDCGLFFGSRESVRFSGG